MLTVEKFSVVRGTSRRSQRFDIGDVRCRDGFRGGAEGIRLQKNMFPVDSSMRSGPLGRTQREERVDFGRVDFGRVDFGRQYF